MVRVVIYHTDAGIMVALVKELRSGNLRVMTISYPLHARTVPGSEARHMRDLTRNGKPYRLALAVNKFRRLGSKSRMGMTKAGRKFVNEIAEEAGS
jgi:hypothetical protein